MNSTKTVGRRHRKSADVRAVENAWRAQIEQWLETLRPNVASKVRSPLLQTFHGGMQVQAQRLCDQFGMDFVVEAVTYLVPRWEEYCVCKYEYPAIQWIVGCADSLFLELEVEKKVKSTPRKVEISLKDVEDPIETSWRACLPFVWNSRDLWDGPWTEEEIQRGVWTSDEVWKGVWTRTHQNISKRLVEKFGVDRTIWMVSVILRNWEAFKNSYYIALNYPSLKLVEQFSRSWMKDSETGTVRVFEGTHYGRAALVPPVEGVEWPDAASSEEDEENRTVTDPSDSRTGCTRSSVRPGSVR